MSGLFVFTAKERRERKLKRYNKIIEEIKRKICKNKTEEN